MADATERHNVALVRAIAAAAALQQGRPASLMGRLDSWARTRFQTLRFDAAHAVCWG
ncbi:MAG: hypothetical protein AB1716_23800 [Planctomycetota bacterium]